MKLCCSTSIASYFNPCETYFEKFSFRKLSCNQQAATVFFTCIGGVFCLIGGLAAYRACLKQFSIVPLNPHNVASDADIDIELQLEDDSSAFTTGKNAHAVAQNTLKSSQAETFPDVDGSAVDITSYAREGWPNEEDGI